MNQNEFDKFVVALVQKTSWNQIGVESVWRVQAWKHVVHGIGKWNHFSKWWSIFSAGKHNSHNFQCIFDYSNIIFSCFNYCKWLWYTTVTYLKIKMLLIYKTRPKSCESYYLTICFDFSLDDSRLAKLRLCRCDWHFFIGQNSSDSSNCCWRQGRDARLGRFFKKRSFEVSCNAV